MSDSDTSAAGAGRRVVCLGEALVDFVCERPVAALAEAESFVPRLGGSLANIAVCAARFGADVELLGGAGSDEWGRWLRDRLGAEGVDVGRFVLLEGAGTSHAFVAVDAGGEPSFAFYGHPERPAAHAAQHLHAALAGPAGVLVLGSDTLLGPAEQEVTMRAARLATERGWIVLCDPNLRPRRWPDEATMRATIRELVAAATVVKLNEAEAATLTGVGDARRAGEALRDDGPAAVLITRGRLGALAVSTSGIESVGGREAQVVDATGAGDSVAGVVAAALARGARPERLGPALEVAMDTASRVVGVWGATEGLPPAAEARAALAAATTPPNVPEPRP